MVTPMLNTKKECDLIYPFGKLRMLLFEMIPFFHPPVHHVSHLLICAPAPMTGFLYPHSTTFLFIFEFFCTTCTFHNTTDKKRQQMNVLHLLSPLLCTIPPAVSAFHIFSSHKCNTESMESRPKSMPPDLQGKHRKSSSFLPPKVRSALLPPVQTHHQASEQDRSPIPCSAFR